MTFIEYILKVMEEKKITAYKLCKDIGMSQQTFKNWKDGKIPAVDKAITVITYLGLSADEVFGIKKEKVDLTPEEQSLLEAYRNAAPAMQAAARKLLDAPEPTGKLSEWMTEEEAI